MNMKSKRITVLLLNIVAVMCCLFSLVNLFPMQAHGVMEGIIKTFLTALFMVFGLFNAVGALNIIGALIVRRK